MPLSKGHLPSFFGRDRWTTYVSSNVFVFTITLYLLQNDISNTCCARLWAFWSKIVTVLERTFVAVHQVVCVPCFSMTREVPEIWFSLEGSLRPSDIDDKFISKESQCLPPPASAFITLELWQCEILWYAHLTLALSLKHLLGKQRQARWAMPDLVKPSCQEIRKITGILASLRKLEQTACIS